MSSQHVAVVGAGVVGLMTARTLAEQGHRVTVVDAADAHQLGCSYGNAGMIVPSHFVPLAAPGVIGQALRWMPNPRSPFRIRPRADLEFVRWGWAFLRAANREHVERAAPVLRDLHVRSRALYEQLDQDSAGAIGLVRNGLLMLCTTQHGWHEEQELAERAAALGLPTEILDHDALQAAEPDQQIRAVGAVKYPLDAHLDPVRLMRHLIDDLQRRDVDVTWSTRVLGWTMRDGGIESARTAAGDIAADQFVLAGGSWSGVLARQAGLRLPMEAGRGYSVTIPQPRPTLRHCAILTEARVAVTPFPSELRVGGTMELVGQHCRPDPRRVEGVVRSFTQVFPGYRQDAFASARPWAGMRPCSPDGMPYIGRTRAADNLLVATGHGMMGISLAPVTAELVAAEITTPGGTNIPAPLDPDRYARPSGRAARQPRLTPLRGTRG